MIPICDLCGDAHGDGWPVEGLSRRIEGKSVVEKIVFVPDFHIGRQLGESLARVGRGWVNLRFVTTGTMADEIAGLSLASRGLRRLSAARTRLVLHRIFESLRREGRLPYFGRLDLRPGLVTALHHSLRDLRMAGITSGGLEPDRFIDLEKGAELRLFLERYEDMLTSTASFDAAALLNEAVGLAPEYAARRKIRCFCLETHILTELEKDFITALAGPGLILLQRGHVTKTPAPKRLYYIGKRENGPDRPQSDLERTAWLFALDDAPPPLKDGSLEMFRAVGEVNECREILRRILGEGRALDDVEIIHPSGSAHGEILYKEARRHGLGITFSKGIPAAYAAPGRVFAALLDWMENDFSSPLFRRMFEEENLKGIETPDGGRVGPQEAARILRKARIGWGLSRYLTRLDALTAETAAEKRPEKASEADRQEGGGAGGISDTSFPEQDAARRIKHIRAVRRWVAEAVEGFSEPDVGGRMDLGALCAALSRFLKTNARIRDEEDGRALALLCSRLDDAASEVGVLLEKVDGLEWLRSMSAGIRVGASGPRPGCLHVSTLAEGGYTGRPLTFIAGLSREAVPGARLPDPLLLDEERTGISDRLDLSSDRLRENLYLVTALLSSLRGRAVLSFSSFDIIEGRPAFPSSILLQGHRLLEGDPGLDYTSLLTSLPEAEGFILNKRAGAGETGRDALDETDWWLGRIVDENGLFFDAVESVQDIFPGIERGDVARRVRKSGGLTAFDGYIGPKEGLDPSAGGGFAMSSSRLEALAKCPFGYFIRYVLGVKPPDDVDPNRGAWLDPMQRGSLLHDVFQEFMKGIRDRAEIINETEHRPVLEKTAQDVIGRYRETIPPPSPAVLEREEADLQGACKIFLRAEARRDEPVEPLLFEAAFGRLNEEDGGIDCPVSVEVTEGRRFPLKGRIDRVDRKPDGTYRVIDYKTGSPSKYEGVKTFGGGTCLQPALYSLAAEVILREQGLEPKAEVSEAGYAFPTRRGDGREILFRTPSRDGLSVVLSLLFRFLEEGVFPVPKDAACLWCDFAPVCGADAKTRAAAKMEENPDIYGVFEKLKEYK